MEVNTTGSSCIEPLLYTVRKNMKSALKGLITKVSVLRYTVMFLQFFNNLFLNIYIFFNSAWSAMQTKIEGWDMHFGRKTCMDTHPRLYIWPSLVYNCPKMWVSSCYCTVADTVGWQDFFLLSCQKALKSHRQIFSSIKWYTMEKSAMASGYNNRKGSYSHPS